MRRRQAAAFSFEEAVAVLVRRGVEEDLIRLSSIGEGSLRFVAETVTREAPRRPLRVLHVGNFVGVSLAGVSDIVARHDPQSVVVSIDPNLAHLDVENPQSHALALLDHFGLQRSNVVICGYSLERTANETKVGTFPDTPACEHTLESLERLDQRFDLALIDGNHQAPYLRRELDVLIRMLSEGGLLVLDDVTAHFPDVRELFEAIAADASWPLEKIGQDERLGILRRTSG